MQDFEAKEVIERLQSNDVKLMGKHKRLCLPIINRIKSKMLVEVPFEPIRVYNGVIINGHHRYCASILVDKPIEANEWRGPNEIEIIEWKSVEFTLEEWDTEEKIKMWNKEDAEKLGISESQLNELIERLS